MVVVVVRIEEVLRGLIANGCGSLLSILKIRGGPWLWEALEEEEEEAFMVLATAMWLSPDSTEEALVTSLRSEKRSSSLLRKSMAFLVGAGMEEEIRAPAPAPWLDLGVWKVWERGKPGRFAEGLAVCQKGRPWLWRPLLWLKLG